MDMLLLLDDVDWLIGNWEIGYWIPTCAKASAGRLDTGCWMLGTERCNPEPRAKNPETKNIGISIQ